MTTEYALELIEDKFKKIDIKLSGDQSEKFYRYYEMIIEKNKVMNLTAITDFEEVVLKHFADSCFKSTIYIENNGKGKKLIDVGTGAGFPGIPLKIVFPELEVTLLDSLNKRILFLNDVIEKLGLKGINTIHYRAEDGARDNNLREQFDYVVSRAVANLATLSEYCLPYAKVNGCFAAFKSGAVEEEIENAKRSIFLLGGKEEMCCNGVLPDSDITRSIVIIRKKEHTSRKYPRKAGIPTKQPL